MEEEANDLKDINESSVIPEKSNNDNSNDLSNSS
jgi:hypothetical protein